MLKVKAYKISTRFWIAFFASCNIILVILMAVSLSIFNWVRTDFDTYFVYLAKSEGNFTDFNASSFEGNIFDCVKGCGKLYKDSDYNIVMKDICEYYGDNEKYSNFYTDPDYDAIQSICEMFKNIIKANQFKLIFDFATFVSILLWFIGMLCMNRKNCCYLFTYWTSLFSCLTFFVGSITWFAITAAVFNNCSEIPEHGDSPIICATKGPILMVLIMILFPLLILCYFLVACKAKKLQNELRVSFSNNNPLPDSPTDNQDCNLNINTSRPLQSPDSLARLNDAPPPQSSDAPSQPNDAPYQPDDAHLRLINAPQLLNASSQLIRDPPPLPQSAQLDQLDPQISQVLNFHEGNEPEILFDYQNYDKDD